MARSNDQRLNNLLRIPHAPFCRANGEVQTAEPPRSVDLRAGRDCVTAENDAAAYLCNSRLRLRIEQNGISGLVRGSPDLAGEGASRHGGDCHVATDDVGKAITAVAPFPEHLGVP